MALPFASVDLTPETQQLFVEMAEATLNSTTPAHRMFLLAQHLGGNNLIFSGEPRRDWKDVDPGSLDDLAGLGLLRKGFGGGRGTPNYQLTNDGRRFFEWLMSQRGEPVRQVERGVQAWLGSEGFARRYPTASISLGRALEQLWRGETDEQTASAYGADLRAALQDFAAEVHGQLKLDSSANREKPIDLLEEAVEALADRIGQREKAVLTQLVALCDATLRQVQRIHHVRAEGKLRGWDELRRAGFVLTMVVHELDRAIEATTT